MSKAYETQIDELQKNTSKIEQDIKRLNKVFTAYEASKGAKKELDDLEAEVAKLRDSKNSKGASAEEVDKLRLSIADKEKQIALLEVQLKEFKQMTDRQKLQLASYTTALPAFQKNLDRGDAAIDGLNTALQNGIRIMTQVTTLP